MTRIASRGMEEVPCSFSRSFVQFEGHMGRKIDDFDPISAFPDDCFQGLPFNFNAQGHTGHLQSHYAGRSYQIPQMCLVFNSKRFYVLSYTAMSYIVRRCCRENISWLELSYIYLYCVWFAESEMQVWSVQRGMIACDEMPIGSIIKHAKCPRAYLRNASLWTIVILPNVHMIPHCHNFECSLSKK